MPLNKPVIEAEVSVGKNPVVLACKISLWVLGRPKNGTRWVTTVLSLNVSSNLYVPIIGNFLI